MSAEFRAPPFDVHGTEYYRLWLVATATYGVGDVVTTISLFYHHPGVGETNPLLRWMLEQFGTLGLAGLKLAVMLLFVVVSFTVARRSAKPLFAYTPPTVLAILGAYLTAFNLVILAG